MEFNQDNRSFCTTVAVLDTVAEQLADVDLTLPDYCPDIEKILKCTLIPKIQTRTLSGGQLQIDGSCVVNVLYVDSIKKSIRCCEQSVNFSQSFSVKEAPDNPVILTKTKPEYINCRALSPRRLVMHGAFSLYAKVLSSAKTPIYSPVSESCLETRVMNTKCASLCSLCQEQFSVVEEVSVGDKPVIEAVLSSEVNVNITDTKAVKGKLMVNGEINLKLLYITDVESGETGKLDYLLPFNQIIDCEGISENTVNCVSCDIMSYDIRLKNDVLSEKPLLVLDLKLCLTEEGYMIADEDVVTDAYSVKCATQPKFEQLNVVTDLARLNDSHIEKASIAVDNGKISKVINISSNQITADYTCDDKGITMSGKVNICILAENEDEMPVFIERSIDYTHPMTSSSEFNGALNVEPRVASISYRLADDSTVEIRCEIKLAVSAIAKENIRAVSDVEIFDDRPVKPEECALTLYFAQPGESLWEIAKSHNTALDKLIEENSAAAQNEDISRMLLIPRV